MVSQGAVVYMAVSGAIVFLLLIGLMVWFQRKYSTSFKVFLWALSRILSSLSSFWRALCTAGE